MAHSKSAARLRVRDVPQKLQEGSPFALVDEVRYNMRVTV